MALKFIIENGEGFTNANSYISLDDLKDYWDTFGYIYSNYTDKALMQNIVKATRVIDSRYRNVFPGTRVTSSQGLEWPRENAYYVDDTEIAPDVVPVEISSATAEMVYAAISGTATIQPVNSSEGPVIRTRDKVDVIETEREFTSSASRYATDVITAVDDALSRITGGISAAYNIKIIRVGG